MLSDYVSPGDRLELTSTSFSEDNQKDSEGRPGIKGHVYYSRVYEIRSDEVLEIEMPVEKEKVMLLPVGDEFDVCFYTSSGLYQCYSVIKDRYKTNNLFILVLELTSGLRKFQRREYYRFNCIVNMQSRKLSDEEQDAFETRSVEFLDTDLTLEDGVIVDISGGGARFLSNSKYEDDAKILFRFSLTLDDRPQEYSIVGRIIKSNPTERVPDKYENRVKFLSLDGQAREDIIRYIFEEERRIRRRDNGR